jgi:RNA polymerase sigma factor (sigma-70 family)
VASPAEFAVLVAAVAERRDREAFTRLFDHFAPRVNAYLQRMGLDVASAEEVTQEVMVTLWRKAALFDASKSSLGTWLYRIARNRRVDLSRRDRVDFLDPAAPALAEAEADAVGLDRLVDGQQREEAVRLALDNLPQEQLALVRFAFFDGLSHSQIADRTGLPLGTVKSRLRLAFTRLRRLLETKGVLEVG